MMFWVYLFGINVMGVYQVWNRRRQKHEYARLSNVEIVALSVFWPIVGAIIWAGAVFDALEKWEKGDF